MNCPDCGAKSRGVDSRTEASRNSAGNREIREDPFPALGVTVCARRRRECGSCGLRFTTWEVPAPILERAEIVAEAVDTLQRAGRVMLANRERTET